MKTTTHLKPIPSHHRKQQFTPVQHMVELQKPPRAFYPAAVVEFCERLFFYTLIWMLPTFASSPISNGGLGWSGEAGQHLTNLYVVYSSLLLLMGGVLIDRVFGLQKATLIGGFMMGMGGFLLAFAGVNTFCLFTGLGVIACGSALVKPSVLGMVGLMGAPAERRNGQLLFWHYAIINLAGCIANVITNLESLNIYFHPFFISIAALMYIGMGLFWIGQAYLQSSVPYFCQTISMKLSITAQQKICMFHLAWILVIFAAWNIAWYLCYSIDIRVSNSLFSLHFIGTYNIPPAFLQGVEAFFILLAVPIHVVLLHFFDYIRKPLHIYSQFIIGLIALLVCLGFLTITTYINHEVVLNFPCFCLFFICVIYTEVLVVTSIRSLVCLIVPQAWLNTCVGIILALYFGLSIFSNILAKHFAYGKFEYLITAFITLLICVIFVFLYQKKLIINCDLFQKNFQQNNSISKGEKI